MGSIWIIKPIKLEEKWGKSLKDECESSWKYEPWFIVANIRTLVTDKFLEIRNVLWRKAKIKIVGEHLEVKKEKINLGQKLVHFEPFFCMLNLKMQ